MLLDNKDLMKSGEAAAYIGVCTETLRRWDYHGILVPVYRKPNGHRYYSKEQVEEYIKKQEALVHN